MLKPFLIVSSVALSILCVEVNKPANKPLMGFVQLAVIMEPETLADTLPKKSAKATKAPPAAKFEKGKALIAQSDCLACHRETEKLVGPSYADVAKKYKPTKENVALLVNKVIAGGKGNWGEVPMLPHATLAQADAKEMVNYILSLKAK
jgi:cytochrome c